MAETIYVQAMPRKSMVAALLLTLAFGPLGLFYVSITGGILMSLLFCILLLLSVITLGLFSFLLVLPWFGSMLWAALGVDRSNKKAVAGARLKELAPEQDSNLRPTA